MESKVKVSQLAGYGPIALHWQHSASGQPEQPIIDWCDLGEVRFTDPFFSDTVARCLRHPYPLLFRHRTPMDTARELHQAHSGLAPTGFIFHMSRCGSTLIAQMLAALPQNIVLSEAPPLDFILRAHYQVPGISPEQRIAWLQWLVSALGQPRQAEAKHLFIKWDCWHTIILPLIHRAFPDVPWIFVYRDPVEVMVSHLRQRGMQMIPGMVEPSWFGLEATNPPLPFEEYSARVLAAICEAALQHRHSGRGRFVNYQQLPTAVWSWLPEFFGIHYSAADTAQMQRVAGVNAKNPCLPFEADATTKKQQATPAIRAQAEQWVQPLYERLEELSRGQRPVS